MSKFEIEVPELPEGWKPVAYRPARSSEYVFHTGEVEQAHRGTFMSFLIVERIKPKRVILEATGEVRKPVIGEYVLHLGSSFTRCNSPDAWGMKCEIWREVKEEE